MQVSSWSAYVLRVKEPELYPGGVVQLRTIDEDAHLLTTGGWIGDVRVASRDGSGAVRVVDSKLDGAAWQRLLYELSRAVAALPLAELVDGSDLERSPKPPTPLVQRLVLRAHVESLTKAWDAIARRPHEALEIHDEWTTPDRAASATPGAVVAALQRGHLTTTGPVAERLGGFAPTAWRDVQRSRSFDTPENRFARYATELALAVALRFPDDELLTEVARRARLALARPPLRDAGTYRRYPAASRALRERHGYRELRDAFLALTGSAKVRWRGLGDALRGGLRNTEVLYQFWCFLALQRHLGCERPVLPTRRTASELHIELSVGSASAVETPRGHLWHERHFASPQGAYAVPMRPDFALARHDGKLDLYDAKFRLDPASEAKHEDIAKMHAYRDAVRGCHSAWVLYPGIRSEVYPVEPQEHLGDPRGVGVIAMRP